MKPAKITENLKKTSERIRKSFEESRVVLKVLPFYKSIIGMSWNPGNKKACHKT